jgi:hypothetical protein
MAFLTDEIVDRPAVRTRCGRVYCADEQVVVIPRGRYWNLCLRDIFEEVCGLASPDDLVWFQIAPGAIIGSRSARLAALRRGWWPGEYVEPTEPGIAPAPFQANPINLAVRGLPWR